MDLALGADQELLLASFDELFGHESDGDRVRTAEERGFDPTLWRALTDTGTISLRVPAEDGGGGASLFDTALVLDRAGRHLATGPLAGAIVAARVLAETSGRHDHAGERVQFGHFIGQFQGIAHPLADAVAEVEGGHLLVWNAIWRAAVGHPDAAATASMAFAWAAEAGTRATGTALHTFGGYGLALEYDAQLHQRRAKAWAAAAGDPTEALIDVADRRGTASTLPCPTWATYRSTSPSGKQPSSSAPRSAAATSIYGGSSEIIRSIIAEATLGMPRSRS